MITYTIQFLSDWHCSSGLSGGAETDANIIKDSNNMPYVPGKTIKGLLRDLNIEIFKNSERFAKFEETKMLLGKEVDKEDGTESISGNLFFSNAILCKEEYDDVVINQLQPYLYRNISSTRIDELGVASDKSLRVTEVCMPLKLSGSIQFEYEDDFHANSSTIEELLKCLRALGMNRNRGLGRCKINISKS